MKGEIILSSSPARVWVRAEAQITSAAAAQNVHENQLRSTTHGAAVSSGLVWESAFRRAAELQTQATDPFVTTREAKSPRHVDSIQRHSLEPMNMSCQLKNTATYLLVFPPSPQCIYHMWKCNTWSWSSPAPPHRSHPLQRFIKGCIYLHVRSSRFTREQNKVFQVKERRANSSQRNASHLLWQKQSSFSYAKGMSNAPLQINSCRFPLQKPQWRETAFCYKTTFII